MKKSVKSLITSAHAEFRKQDKEGTLPAIVHVGLGPVPYPSGQVNATSSSPSYQDSGGQASAEKGTDSVSQTAPQQEAQDQSYNASTPVQSAPPPTPLPSSFQT